MIQSSQLKLKALDNPQIDDTGLVVGVNLNFIRADIIYLS